MPLTFPAHQGLILMVKFRWPRHIDAAALCVGAAAPDLAYPLGTWMSRQSHTAIGLAVWAVPYAVVAALLIRRWAAPGLFACMPDLGPVKLRSYGVIARRRPLLRETLGSAIIGASSHVLIDGFTHTGRWGADWLNLNGTVFSAPIRGAFSWARVLQYIGHGGGTLLFVVLLAWIASSGHLTKWYGEKAVREARAVRASSRQRAAFATTAAVATMAAAAIPAQSGIQRVFLAQTILIPALIGAGILITRSLRTR